MLPDTTVFLVLAGSVYKFVEFIKPSLAKLNYSNDVYNALVQFLACLIGVVLAFVAGGVNMFPAILPIPQVVGVVLTGVIVGLGADVVNAVLDLVYGWQKPTLPTAPPVVTPPAA